MNQTSPHANINTSCKGDFADNPIVYFLIIDRFLPPVPEEGCCNDPFDRVGTFHGGRLQGVTSKIRQGWFNALGVNALWLTSPFEQIPGWVPGGNGEFRHFAYHGYYPHDYTRVDRRYGSEGDLRELVDEAHAHGLRVIIDAVINHPGYLDLHTLGTYMRDALSAEWENATPSDYARHMNSDSPAILNWWGPEWVRANLPGYQQGGVDELTMLVAGLPDFKTENPTAVDLPAFLKLKDDTHAVQHDGFSVRDYLTEWFTRWVREFGIDGFRCDSAKHVDVETWQALKSKCTEALAQWKNANPHKKIDDCPFWMTGEVFGNWIDRVPYYDNGFDNLINFGFQHEIDQLPIDDLFSRYASKLGGRPGHNVLSYLSSHDT